MCHIHSWFLPKSLVLDLSILLSIFVCIYVRPVYHYIAATVTVVYLAQRFITACVVVIWFYIARYPICKFQSLFSFWIACDIPNIEVDTKKQVARHNQPSVYFEVYIHTRQNNTTRLLIISCNNIVFTITTALYAGSVYYVLHSDHA